MSDEDEKAAALLSRYTKGAAEGAPLEQSLELMGFRKISAACKLCTARRRVPLNKEPDKPYKGQTNKGRLFFFPPPHH